MPTNKEIVEDFLDLINRQHRVREAFERYVAERYIQHNPQAPDGREGGIAIVSGFVTQPGFRATVKRIIAEGDLVVTHMHIQIGDDDPGMAIADFFRFEGGKVVEHWDVIQPVPASTASGHPML